MRYAIVLVGLLSWPGCRATPDGPSADGEGATVTAEMEGANCATGGVKLQAGEGAPTYVCNGATGAEGQMGLQGAEGSIGAPGVSVTGWTLLAEDLDCPAGGSAFESSTGVSFACNGAVGPRGEEGVAGETGPEGLQGVAGETGPAGPQGVAGETGQQGPQGVAGWSTDHLPGGHVAFSTLTSTVIDDLVTTSATVGVVTVALPADGPLTLAGEFPDRFAEGEPKPILHQTLVIHKTPQAGRMPVESAFSVQLTLTGDLADFGTCSCAVSPEEPVARASGGACVSVLSAMLVSDSLITVTTEWQRVTVVTPEALSIIQAASVDPGGSANGVTLRVRVENLGGRGAPLVVGVVCPSPIDVVPAQEVFLEQGGDREILFDLRSPAGFDPSPNVRVYAASPSGRIFDEIMVVVSQP